MGLQVMNFHKAKGKQFDGVIIVREARRTGPAVESSFVWRGDTAPYPKSRRVLRVGITRARIHTFILDPLLPGCPILGGTNFSFVVTQRGKLPWNAAGKWPRKLGPKKTRD